MPGCCYEEEVDKQDRDFRVGEYYSECVRDGPGRTFRVNRRGHPYWRHGFPHTGGLLSAQGAEPGLDSDSALIGVAIVALTSTEVSITVFV